MTRRVVVTGLGLVTPFGDDVDVVWERMLAGNAGVTAPTRCGDVTPPTRAVGEVDEATLDRLRRTFPDAAQGDLRTLFGVAAGANAARDAGLDKGVHDRAGAILGSGPGVHRLEDVGVADAQAVHRESLIRNSVEQPAVLLARRLRLGGPVHAVTTACSASNQALGLAFRSVRSGETDWVIAGGADSMINPIGLVFFVLLGASASDAGDPATACKPFDRRRSGLVMGEGAGCVVLEDLDHARARGARIYAEVVGYGSSLDAYRTTAPPPDGRGAAQAMTAALRDGDVRPQDVQFVNAHGTGTKRNDPAEVRAIHTVFGDHAASLAVSSGKGAIGHLLSAAAGVAFIFCVLAIRRGAVPPTRNLTHPDPACDLDLVPDAGRAAAVRTAINNSFAFGGQNAVVAVRAFGDDA